MAVSSRQLLVLVMLGVVIVACAAFVLLCSLPRVPDLVYPIRIGDATGFVDQRGSVVIEPQYDVSFGRAPGIGSLSDIGDFKRDLILTTGELLTSIQRARRRGLPVAPRAEGHAIAQPIHNQHVQTRTGR